MIEREPEKLAYIEKQIEEVKEHGFGQVTIEIKDSQIVFSKSAIFQKWSVTPLTEIPPSIILEVIE